MKTYEEKELFDWMAAQPDDRPVNMKVCSIGYGQCGCLLSQFFSEKGDARGLTCLQGILNDEDQNTLAKVELHKQSIFQYFEGNPFYMESFGELKTAFCGI